MQIECPQCGRPGRVTWSGQVGQVDQESSRTTQLVIRCPDLHWSVRSIDDVAAVPADDWSVPNVHRSRSRSVTSGSPRRQRMGRAA